MDANQVRAYKKIAKLTGFQAEELVQSCMALVKDEKSRHYGRIGILEDFTVSDRKVVYYMRFNGKRRVELGYDFAGWPDLEEKFFCSPNVLMIYEQFVPIEQKMSEIERIKKVRRKERIKRKKEKERYPLFN